MTDRHPQIQKHIREEMKSTTHYFDVWHVAKGKLVLREVIDTCMKFTLTQWQYLRWLVLLYKLLPNLCDMEYIQESVVLYVMFC